MDSKLIRSTAIWYLICVSLFAILAELGRNSGSEIVYHYGDSRDHWWDPLNLTLTFVIVWILPLPHQVIALAFKSKRNLVSQVKIFRGWMTILGNHRCLPAIAWHPVIDDVHLQTATELRQCSKKFLS